MKRLISLVLGGLLAAASVGPLVAQDAPAPRGVVQEAPSGWLGVSLEQINRTSGAEVRHDVVVRLVWEESPAAAAGIRAGDQIIRVNGEPVSGQTMDQLRTQPGEQVVLTLRRGERTLDVEIVAAERPRTVAWTTPAPTLSAVRVDSLTNDILVKADSLRVSLRLMEGRGPVVYSFSTDSLVEGAPGSRVVVRGGFDEAVEVTPGTWTYTMRMPEPDESAPFGLFVRRTEETDSLLREREQLREERDRVRRAEVTRERELLEQSAGGAPASNDPQLSGLRRTRLELEEQLKALDMALATTSLEILKRAPPPDRAVAVGTGSQPEAVRSLFPYLVGQRFVAGAELTALNPQLAEYFPVSEGILVTEVLRGSPADLTGLRAGDIITHVGDVPVVRVEGLRKALSGLMSSDEPTVTVVRKSGPEVLHLKR
jgi:membrane-associated protease RseP (regulator of RpoE activity)